MYICILNRDAYYLMNTDLCEEPCIIQHNGTLDFRQVRKTKGFSVVIKDEIRVAKHINNLITAYLICRIIFSVRMVQTLIRLSVSARFFTPNQSTNHLLQ